jgi:hypothetical protein
MPVPRRPPLLAAVAVAAILGASSCADEAGDATLSSPTTSATSQQLGPELPDDDAVRAALSTYYAAVNRAVTNRSVAVLDTATIPECPCRDRYVQVIDRLNDQGLTTSNFFVTGVASGDVALEGDSATLTSIETTQAYDIVDADGTVVDQVGPAQTLVVYTFTAVDGDWLVSGADDDA